jgi:hypothetical protein
MVLGQEGDCSVSHGTDNTMMIPVETDFYDFS